MPHSSARKKPATNDEIAASSGGLPFALLSVCTNRVAKRFDFCLLCLEWTESQNSEPQPADPSYPRARCRGHAAILSNKLTPYVVG